MAKNYYVIIILTVLFYSCTEPYFKNDYVDNSPTSGKLKVYYDEGMRLHIHNQTLTFQSQYPRAEVKLFEVPEGEAVQALYNDSCKAIMISRLLNKQETKAFQSKGYNPKYSAIAKSGVALITNLHTSIIQLSVNQVKELLSKPFMIKDSTLKDIKLKAVFDKNNSSVIHYLADSILQGQKFSSECNSLSSSLEAINYVAQNKNTIAFIDFAWLSDEDDSIFKANKGKIKFIAISKTQNEVAEYPNQSTFKLGTYPFTRTVYIYRNAGEFSLAKGFESYVAGPKGQLTFLKQGILPHRQSERSIEAKTE